MGIFGKWRLSPPEQSGGSHQSRMAHNTQDGLSQWSTCCRRSGGAFLKERVHVDMGLATQCDDCPRSGPWHDLLLERGAGANESSKENGPDRRRQSEAAENDECAYGSNGLRRPGRFTLFTAALAHLQSPGTLDIACIDIGLPDRVWLRVVEHIPAIRSDSSFLPWILVTSTPQRLSRSG